MDIDPPKYHTPSSSSQREERYELTDLNQISLPLRPQVEIFNVVKTKEFTHTPILDNALLHETGMDSEFELIFRMIGWEDAWEITKQGSKLLTIEFISSLDFDDDNVLFRMFNKLFTLTWKTFSIALGFSEQCVVNIADVLRDFNKDVFWENITAKKPERKQKYTTKEVHHPTLRCMLKSLGFTFFPREELNTIRQDELHLLYIMIKKRKASPVKLMLSYWKTMPSMRKYSISFTSWITRLATSLDLLSKAILTFVPDVGRVIGYDFFLLFSYAKMT